MAIDRDLRIVGLEVENFKRIKAVNLEIDPNFQIITGRNAQGKSSILDAIWAALAGGKASPERPIRDGEEEARVSVDLGEVVATRKWKGDKSTITLETQAGAKFGRPQTELDSVIGKLSFDPVAFMSLSAAQQRNDLLALVPGLGDSLAEIDKKREAVYQARLDAGRERDRIGVVEEPSSLEPVEEITSAELFGAMRAAEEKVLERRNADEAKARLESELEATRAEIRRLEEVRDALEHTLAECGKEWNKLDSVEALEAAFDSAQAALADADDRNREIREQNQQIGLWKARKEYADLWSKHDAELKALDKQKSELLGRAKFPVEGLGFDETGVTYKGIPLEQASAAEQRKVSTAIARAFNPKLRTAFIRDGSLLDGEAMAWFRQDAVEHDYQLLVERVQDDDPAAIVIEDGEVLGW